MNEGKTKAQLILDPNSDWNNAMNDEPLFVIRANNWKGAMLLAILSRNEAATDMVLEAALKMREYSKRHDEIPF